MQAKMNLSVCCIAMFVKNFSFNIGYSIIVFVLKINYVIPRILNYPSNLFETHQSTFYAISSKNE